VTATEHLVRKLPNDIGGEPADPIERVEHELEPWEKCCHALADVLDFHKIINTDANIAFQKGLLTPEELARKMEEVKARWTAYDPDSRAAHA
jgi:hypothetical protein